VKVKVEQKPVKQSFWYHKNTKSVTVWVVEILLVLALAAGVSFAFGTSVTIQEGSMDPTLQAGDSALINKIAYAFGGIGRGDLIAYKNPDQTDASIHVKRVIGLPGESIQIKDGLILINGKTYIEDKELPGINNAGLAENGIKLGSNEYFVLGDNRNNSEDSRFADVGNISRVSIIGKVWFITSPLSEFGFVN